MNAPYPGELLHMDTKKIAAIPLGGGWAVHGRGNVAQQGVGYVFVHSIVDDHTRLAYSEPLPDEKAPTVVGFLTRALDNLRQHGIRQVRAIMTDNHPGYKRSLLFQALLERHGIKHITINPPCPQQDGKVERYHLTLKREWINQQAWPDEETRTQAPATGSTTTTTTDPTQASEENHPPDCQKPNGHLQLGGF